MIIARTTLKNIPEKCTKCKYADEAWEDNFHLGKYCRLTRRFLQQTFVKEKHNWVYLKPDWCPLMEVDYDEEKLR